jgi:phosphoserine phosphatase RsbU/P
MERAHAAGSPSSLSAASPRGRVLVADDQPAVIEALRWLLSGEGYDLTAAGSAGAVLEQLRAGPFDLLLMDLNYSRDTTSGREGLDLIPLALAVDATLPIVVMTGWGSIATAVEAMRRGAKSFVQKPWDEAALVEIVAREIAEARALRRRDHAIQREFEEAHLIQRGLLPTAMPDLRGVRVTADWQPADGVGGDCFDVQAFGSVLAVSIADVAGKGLPAALLMSNLQAAVRAFSRSAIAPSSLCSRVNRLLCRSMVSGRFATFCYVRIDVRAGHLACANAGHNPPLLVRPDGRVDRLSTGGVVLGVFPDATYDQIEVALGRGDRLILYTDGLTEARNAADEEYGETRLAEAALALRNETVDDMKSRLMADVRAHATGGLDDDATLIVVGIE